MRLLGGRSGGIGPAQGAQINWAHPLARGLAVAIVAVPGGFVDLVSGLTFKPNATGGTPTKRGYATTNTATNALNVANLPKQPPRPLTAYTCASGFVYDNANLASSGATIASWYSDGVNNGPFDQTIVTGDKVRVVANMVSAGYQTTSSTTALTNGEYYDVITCWDSIDGMGNIYIDGQLDTSQWLLATGQNLVAVGTFGLYSNWTAPAMGRHGIAYSFVWNDRRFNAAEAKAFYADPFQILARAPIVPIIAAPPVGGSSVAAASGTGTASAIPLGIGSSTGTGTASGVSVGSASVGSASGTSTANAVPLGIGSAIGSGAATAIALGIGNATGTGSASAIPAGTNVGSVSGTSTANAIPLGIGSATGTGTATARPLGIGSANGTGSASGIAPSIGNAAGTGSATGVGSASIQGVGSASGVGTASGVSTTAGSFTGVGSASGFSTVTGIANILPPDWVSGPANDTTWTNSTPSIDTWTTEPLTASVWT